MSAPLPAPAEPAAVEPAGTDAADPASDPAVAGEDMWAPKRSAGARPR